MNDDRVVSIVSQSTQCDPSTELLREKAVELLQVAVNAECAELLNRFAEALCAGEDGHLPRRSIVIGIGPVSVTVPRVRDRTGQRMRFESKLVPAYVLRAKSINALLPWLYCAASPKPIQGPGGSSGGQGCPQSAEGGGG